MHTSAEYIWRGLPADSEIRKKWPLGLHLYRSFKEEIKGDVAVNGSFSRSLTTVCYSVFGTY